MRKSELRQMIREEISRLNESGLDGTKVKAIGITGKGLKDGKTYTLKSAAPYRGEETYNFMLGRRAAARFPASSIHRWLHSIGAGDHNGLKKV